VRGTREAVTARLCMEAGMALWRCTTYGGGPSGAREAGASSVKGQTAPQAGSTNLHHITSHHSRSHHITLSWHFVLFNSLYADTNTKVYMLLYPPSVNTGVYCP
jgi:hypothetical protein